jgi:hypothetical protein
MEDDMACSYEQNLHYGAGYVKYNIAKKEAKKLLFAGGGGTSGERARS